MNSRYLRKDNEDDLDYAMRIIEIKKEERPDDLDWEDIVKLLGVELNKDSLRKSQDTMYGGLAVYNKMKQKNNNNDLSYEQEIIQQTQELKKERMKIADERNALNRLLRSESRKESIESLMKECANIVAKENPITPLEHYTTEGEEQVAVLTLSDFHYGLVINEFNNKYNPEIFIERINHLMAKVEEYINLNGITTLYVLGLGDYFNGIIHTTTRLENRENIVKQVMNVSEKLAQMLIELSRYVVIYYYDVTDNHGRVFPNKDDWQNRDNFSLFVKWYLQGRFEDISYINIMDNEYNEEIGSIEIFGRNYAFTHGHRDKIENVVQNLSLMTKKVYDAIFIGHGHHFAANEIHGTYVYMNGTLSGTDEYANNIRVTSNPSQNLFIIGKDNGIKCQYLIKL